MPRLSKRELFHVFENAVLDSGWNFLSLTRPNEHPAMYQVYRAERGHTVRLYVWNLTHGGGRMRAADEYRIQITGIGRFTRLDGQKTLILGWWDKVGVFAGFDFSHHARTLGESPSIQIREAALQAASTTSFAPHRRGQNEIAIAFRPDFMGAYIDNLEALHAVGEVPAELALLERVGKDPDAVPEKEIVATVAQPRQYAVTATRRAIRESDFNKRILIAYEHQCAMCATQLRLVDAAHILPVVDPRSTDETCNGVALCALHHRAYDRALVTFDAEYRTHLNDSQAAELERLQRHGGLSEFRARLRPIIALPPEKRDWPRAAFVQTANELRGWRL